MATLMGGVMLLGFAGMTLIGKDENGSMLQYHLKTMARRALFGRHQSRRMYHEEQRQKTLEAIKDNPDRDQIIKANPWIVRER